MSCEHKIRAIVELGAAIVLVVAINLRTMQKAPRLPLPQPSIAPVSEPNFADLESELDELKWQAEAQMSYQEQIAHMAKEK